jgi:hypothetical protein
MDKYNLTQSGLSLEGNMLLRCNDKKEIVSRLDLTKLTGVQLAEKWSRAGGLFTAFVFAGGLLLIYAKRDWIQAHSWAWLAAGAWLFLLFILNVSNRSRVLTLSFGADQIDYSIHDDKEIAQSFVVMLKQHHVDKWFDRSHAASSTTMPGMGISPQLPPAQPPPVPPLLPQQPEPEANQETKQTLP